ncbi:MAG: arylesterase [Hydrogenophilales bacterium]|nr:arylesterase [Hydrogenophilales bacterium]
MKLLFLRGLIAAFCLVAGVGHAQPDSDTGRGMPRPYQPAGGAQKILVLGDSLSASYGLAQTSAWVSLLQQRLAAEKFPHQVINASISGETTSGGLYRIDALLASHRPKVVILALGANDGLRGLSLEATQSNLEAMIRRAKKNRAQVLLIGMRLPPNYGPAYTEKFHRVYEQLALKYQTKRVPFLLAPIAGKREYFQADGLHPTAEAQPLLLDTVWPVLRPMLKR